MLIPIVIEVKACPFEQTEFSRQNKLEVVKLTETKTFSIKRPSLNPISGCLIIPEIRSFSITALETP